MASRRPWQDAVRNLSLKASSLGLERACRFVVVVACARSLGQESFGRFVFASTVTALLAFGTDMGLGLWTTRTLARERRQGGRVVRVGLTLRGLAAIPYAMAVWAVATLRAETRSSVLLLGVAALAGAFVDHFGSVLRGHERFADEARLNAARALLTVASGLTALTLGQSLVALCAALATASLGSLAYGTTVVLRLHGGAAPPVGARFDRALARRALDQSLPIWFAGLLSLLYFNVDTLFLQFMVGDAELGAYRAAYKLFEGSMLVPSAVLAVTFPRLARAHEEPAAKRTLERGLATTLLVTGLSCAAVCLVAGSPILRWVFGPGFSRAVASLRVLALGVPLLYLNYGLTHFLIARDRGRVTTWLAMMMLLLNVGLDYALIPSRGGPGAASATVLSEVALTVGCLVSLMLDGRSSRSPPSALAAAKTGQRVA